MKNEKKKKQAIPKNHKIGLQTKLKEGDYVWVKYKSEDQISGIQKFLSRLNITQCQNLPPEASKQSTSTNS